MGSAPQDRSAKWGLAFVGLIIILALLALSACSLPSGETEDEGCEWEWKKPKASHSLTQSLQDKGTTGGSGGRSSGSGTRTTPKSGGSSGGTSGGATKPKPAVTPQKPRKSRDSRPGYRWVLDCD